MEEGLTRQFDVTAAPAIVGMILGPLAEQNLRRAVTISPFGAIGAI